MTTAESIATPQRIARRSRQRVLDEGRVDAIAATGVAQPFLSAPRVALAGWAKRSTLDPGDIPSKISCGLAAPMAAGSTGAVCRAQAVASR